MAKHVAVLGGGVGGLSAAIHARQRGHSVLLLERHARVGGKAAGIEIEGFRLDPGPSIIILKRLYENVFRAAGRRMEDYLVFRPLDPISRVLFEGRSEPLDLPASLEKCLALLESIAPEDARAFATMMAKLDAVAPLIDASIFDHPYDKPWQLADPKLIGTAVRFDVRKTYKAMVDAMYSSPLLRAFFYGFPSYGGQTYDSKAPGALMIPYLMLREGVYYPEGGVMAIPKALERLARELGVEIRTGFDVAAAEVAGGRLRSVRSAEGERIEADAFISNIDRLTFERLLGRNVEVSPSLSYFTVHWGFRERLEGFAHHTLLVPSNFESGFESLYRRKTLPDRPILYLNDTTSTDPGVAPPGGTNLFAVVTSPAKEPHLDWEALEPRYVGVVKDELRRFGYDLPEPVFERVQSPRYFEAQHGNYRGTLYGPEEASRLFGGLFPLRNRDEQIGNLFYCGGAVQPGAGLPMVLLSGKFAAGYL